MGENPDLTRDAPPVRGRSGGAASYHLVMTTGPADAMTGVGGPGPAGAPAEQRFPDALGGPDGTGDPAILMPVLQVYPDALSAPMPDALVAVPPIDPAALLAAARAQAATALPTPVQARLAAQRAWSEPDRVAQPGRRGGDRSPSRRPAPATWAAGDPRGTARPEAARPAGAPSRPVPPASMPSGPAAWAARTPSPAEVAGFLRSTFSGVTQGMTQGVTQGLNRNLGAVTQRHQPAAHAPTPPLPRTSKRRNRGSSVWAVLVFLVIIAFASGVAQQVLTAISGLFNR